MIFLRLFFIAMWILLLAHYYRRKSTGRESFMICWACVYLTWNLSYLVIGLARVGP